MYVIGGDKSIIMSQELPEDDPLLGAKELQNIESQFFGSLASGDAQNGPKNTTNKKVRLCCVHKQF